MVDNEISMIQFFGITSTNSNYYLLVAKNAIRNIGKVVWKMREHKQIKIIALESKNLLYLLHKKNAWLECYSNNKLHQKKS